MEDIDSALVLREKLLAAGIDEITEYGISGFSLRRVAAACGASCAAPYKHFKNKEEFIREIIRYVEEKWDRLAAQISGAFEDPCERIAELCAANVRFKTANPLYGMPGSQFAPVIIKEIKDIKKDSDASLCIFAVSALTRGTAALIESGCLSNSQETFAMLKSKIMEELR